MSEAMQPMDETDVNQTAADALRYAAKCIDELVAKGEPMGDRQTFRRGYNAADDKVVESDVTGAAFEECIDTVGDVAGMALEHGISGSDAAEFYRNKADAMDA